MRNESQEFRQASRVPDSDKLLRLVFASAVEYAIYTIDPQGFATSWNPGAERVLGFSADEIIGRSADVIFTPEDRALGVPAAERRQATLTGRGEGERWQQRKDGARFWASGLLLPLSDPSAGYVRILRDRTEPHAAERKRRPTADMHDLRQLKDQQQVLMAELQHRTRNLLAVVQSIATQTLRKSESLETFGREFSSRLRALSRVQALWARHDRQDVDLRDLVVTELSAHRDDAPNASRVAIEGPSILLPAGSALVLGLGLHELATNAVKYGALSQGSGKLFVVWRLERQDGRPCAVLEWAERGVSMRAVTPGRKGYGSELIERALPYQLGARTRLEFAGDGVRCMLSVPLEPPDS